jgi:phosphomevalonate kinase
LALFFRIAAQKNLLLLQMLTVMNSQQQEQPSRKVWVSAPGKVLLCGGYLILEPEHSGMVLAVDKRFYCHGQLLATRSQDFTRRRAVAFRVNSPQFGEVYKFEWGGGGTTMLIPSKDMGPPRNSFVEQTLQICCEYYAPQLHELLSTHVRTAARAPAPAMTRGSSTAAADATLTPALPTTDHSTHPESEPTSRSSPGNTDDDECANIHLSIYGDNEFWCHPSPLSSSRGQDARSSDKETAAAVAAVTVVDYPNRVSRRYWRRFLAAPRDQTSGQVLKTGLGSSACLVTSLVAALDYLLLPEKETPADAADNNDDNKYDNIASSDLGDVTGIPRRRRLDRICRLAQLCHCVAQGKVGSGFDVSAACWGSHIYKRFDAGRLDDLLNRDDNSSSPSYCVREIVQDSTWASGCIVSKIMEQPHLDSFPPSPPPLLQLLLADTAGGGTSSPGMSRRVMQHVGLDAWNHLASANRSVIDCWKDLEALEASVRSLLEEELSISRRDQLMDLLATRTSVEWTRLVSSSDRIQDDDAVEDVSIATIDPNLRPLVKLLADLSWHLTEWRHALKRLGEVADVELEPDCQGELADATQALPGVVCAVIPGAGGHDALACLHVNHPEVRDRIIAMWRSRGVIPLDVRIVPFGEGVRRE